MTLKKGFCLFFFTCAALTNLSAQSLYLSTVGDTQEATLILEKLDYQRSFDDYHSLQNEAKNIGETLAHSGYLESQLRELKSVNDSIFVATYAVGDKYTKAIIHYDGTVNRHLLSAISSAITDNAFEISVTDLHSSLTKLNDIMSNSGDPFVTLQLVNIEKKDGILYADLKTTHHTKRSIDSIVVKGYEKFPKSFIKHYLKLKTQQPFNLSTIKKKTETLENLPFASQIKDPEVLFTKDSTLLYIYVEKQKSNTFDGFLGFGTNTETSKIEFDGYLNLILVNNLNYGESFQLLYKSDESEQKTFDVKTRLPYLFGSPLGMELSLNIFKKDSSYVTTSQIAKIAYQINPNNHVTTGIHTTVSTNLLENQVMAIADYTSTFCTLNYHRSKPQRYDPLFPINLWFEVTAGLGNRKMENSNQAQNKFGVDAFKIFNLNLRNSVYGRVNAEVLNSEGFVTNELFRFGGINSIRGFEENSLTANLYGVFNTEYRYRVSSSLYIHTITDIAYLQNDILNIKQKLLGVGFGFEVLTQAGLFRLNYSNGSSEGQEFKLSNSKVHISLSATF